MRKEKKRKGRSKGWLRGKDRGREEERDRVGERNSKGDRVQGSRQSGWARRRAEQGVAGYNNSSVVRY